MAKKKQKDKKPNKGELEAKKEESFKHRQFAREYILMMGNATAAYRNVYGQEVKGAEASSSKLLTNPKIQDFIAEEQKVLQTQYKSSIDELVEHLFAVVLMDPKLVIDEDLETGEQRFKMLRHIPLQARRTLEISGKGKSVYFRQRSGEKALETLNKYLGLENAGSGPKAGGYSGRDAVERLRKYLNRGDKSE